MLFISYLKVPHKTFIDGSTERRVRNSIILLVLLTVLPSTYLAYNMVTDVAFISRGNDFIKREMSFDNSLITQVNISPSEKKIEATFIGNEITKEQLDEVNKRLTNYNLASAHLVVHQSGEKKVDLTSLKTSLLSELYSSTLKTSEEKDKHIHTLETELLQLKASQPDSKNITLELRTQYPMLQRAALTKTPIWQADGSKSELFLVAYLVVNKSIPSSEQKKIIAWLKVRTKMDNVRLIVSKS